jgi:hypothetical protein
VSSSTGPETVFVKWSRVWSPSGSSPQVRVVGAPGSGVAVEPRRR